MWVFVREGKTARISSFCSASSADATDAIRPLLSWQAGLFFYHYLEQQLVWSFTTQIITFHFLSSPFGLLPLCLHVASFLSQGDCLGAAQVSKTWKRALSCDTPLQSISTCTHHTSCFILPALPLTTCFGVTCLNSRLQSSNCILHKRGSSELWMKGFICSIQNGEHWHKSLQKSVLRKCKAIAANLPKLNR